MADPKMFEGRHNTIALIDTTLTSAEPYLDLLNFLQRSRIHYALTASTPVYANHIIDFWTNATQDMVDGVHRLVTTVLDQQVIITEDTVRTVLQFGNDANSRIIFPATLVSGFFQRIGYPDISPDQYRKQKLCPVWRLFMHFLIVCLSGRKGGLDGMGQSLASAMIALTLNKPYNFSGYVFANLISNISSHTKFYMFPRFVQLILNHLLPNLPNQGMLNLRLIPMTKRVYMDCQNYGRNPTPALIPVFGHIIDEHYQAPANDNWLDDQEVQEDQEQEDDEQLFEAQIENEDAEGINEEFAENIQANEPEEVGPSEPQTHEVNSSSSNETSSSSESSDDSEEAAERIRLEQERDARRERLQKGSAERLIQLQRVRQQKRALVEEAADANYVPDEPPRSKQRKTRASISQVNQPAQQEQMTSSQSLPTTKAQTSTSAPILMSQLLTIMEELKTSLLDQSKLIEKQQEQLDAHAKLIESQKELIDAQSERIAKLEQERDEKENSVVQGENIEEEKEEEEEEEKDEEEEQDEEKDDSSDSSSDDDDANDDSDDKGDGGAQPQMENTESEAVDEQSEFISEQQQPEQTHENKLQMVVYTGPSDKSLNVEEDFLNIEPISVSFNFEENLIPMLEFLDREMDGLNQDSEETVSEELTYNPFEFSSEGEDIEFDSVDVNDDLCDDVVFESDDENDSEELDEEIEAETNPEVPECSSSTKHSEWFRVPTQAPMVKKKLYKVKGECKGQIISWKFDDDLNLIVVKRTGGLQYFKRSFKDLSTLPKCEIHKLAQLNIINHSGSSMGRYIESNVQKEVRHGFNLMKPTLGKRKVYKKKISAFTNKPWVRMVYPPVKALKKIPLEKLPINFAERLKWWYYNGTTGEACIEIFKDEQKEKIEQVFVYDPISLINLSKQDLLVLKDNHIMFNKNEEKEALKFHNVVKICIRNGICAGSNLPSKWI